MIEKKIFTGKLNTDDSYLVMPENDFINAENVRVLSSRQGAAGAVTNVEGDREVSYAPITADTQLNQVIGSCEDRANNRVYYFVYAVSGNHMILSYDHSAGTITKLVHDSDLTGDLNFQENSYIASEIAGGVLYFTDGINEPRKLEVDAILAGSYNPTTVSELGLGAQPPMYSPVVQKIDSVASGIRSERTSNLMRDDAFQFAYRYKYQDNSVSVLSPHSKFVNYEPDDEEDSRDAAIVSIPTNEVIPRRVKKVQFLYRNGNAGSWFVFAEETNATNIANHNTGDVLQFNFFNDRLGNPVSDEISSKAFDLIPRTAKTLDIAKDRLFLGNLLLGYDRIVVPTLAATANKEDASGGVTGVTGNYYHIYWERNDGSFDNWRYTYTLIEVIEGEDYDGYYLVRTISPDDPDFQDYGDLPDVVTITEGSLVVSAAELYTDTGFTEGDPFAFQGALIVQMERYVGIYDEDNPANTPTENEGFGNFPGQPTTATVLGLTNPLSIDGQFFKSSGKYRIGIVFYDKYGRNAGVSTNDNCIIDTSHRTYSTYQLTRNIGWSVSDNSLIPTWATHYQIVRTRNLTTSFFLQFHSGYIQYATRDDDGNYSFGTTYDDGAVSNLAFSAQGLTKEGLGYAFVEGDQLVFYSPDNITRIRLRIEGQYGKYILTESADLGRLSTADTNATGLVEIYRPFIGGNQETYYEVGETYAITNAGEDNRQFSVTSGTLRGDTHAKDRRTPAGTDVTVEAMSVNDREWDTWPDDAGRSNIILYEDGEQTLPNTLVYSNAFVQSTKVNGLSSYELLDRGEVDEAAGPIYRLIYTSSTNDAANVLLAICRNNTASIYIGQTQVIADDGDSILATSGQVIGTINILRGDYGTRHPESVVLSGSFVYWYDDNKQEIVRYATNGLFPISKNGIDSLPPYFAASNWMPAGYDDRHEEYLLRIDTDNGDDLEVLEDFQEQFVGGILYQYSGDIPDDNVTPIPVASTGKYQIGTTKTGRTYQVKHLGSSGTAVVIWVNGIVVDLLVGGDTYTFVADGDYDLEITINNPGLAYALESQRSWYWPIDHEKKVLVYHAPSEGFVGCRTFNADLVQCINNDLVSWEDGKLYVHDSTTKNNFRGTQYNSFIAFVFNQNQPAPYVAKGLFIECNVAPYAHVRTELPYKQSSDIDSTEFEQLDSVWYAPIKRDRLTPGAVDYVAGLLTGDPIRGQFILAMLRFDESTQVVLRAANLEFQIDRGHQLISR